MKVKIISFLLAGLFLIINGFAQNQVPDWAWKSPVSKVFSTGEYYNLPLAQDNVNYENPNKTTRVFSQNGQYFVLTPNVRPFPHTATQSEVDAANMKGNPNLIYALWNSYGPAFYGCGYAASTNGGTSWIGNYFTAGSSGGDPGPWIWPTGSAYAGRLGQTFLHPSGLYIFSSTSTDNGANWDAPVISGGSGITFSSDKNLSAVDDVTGSTYFGRAYTVWTDFYGSYASRIVGAYTSDGGATWSGYQPISPVPSGGHHNQGCDVEVGPGGVVYVIWAHCTTNGQNSTEDNLGFAKSTDGGATWISSSNNVVDVNGIRALNLFNGIRANGFPRLAVDNSGGPRNGWIYVGIGEKFNSPATDAADMCLCRSTDGGSAWTHSRINQDTPGSGRMQFMGDIDVPPDGNVVCTYYDQRNTSGFVTEYWMSRSLDGGSTWVDVALSDHTFTPGPIPGLAGGYQGDYTGLTSGAGKIWAFWADNSSGIYQVWTESVAHGTVGVQQNGNNIPVAFSLGQNYPNPFNPVTNIKFSIPEEKSVKITAFDIAGREAGVILNQLLQPGNYSIDFNAYNLSSGVYFYRITAGNYSNVKKMVLIK